MEERLEIIKAALNDEQDNYFCGMSLVLEFTDEFDIEDVHAFSEPNLCKIICPKDLSMYLYEALKGYFIGKEE